ncbi:MAG: hypothetical protein Q4B14_06430 [Clostridia bacterium]|nr:hypothetical protein [Clostridia bacterium]
MDRNNMNIAKGIGAGLMSGMIVGYVGAKAMRGKAKEKNKISMAMHYMGDIFDKGAKFFS